MLVYCNPMHEMILSHQCIGDFMPVTSISRLVLLKSRLLLLDTTESEESFSIMVDRYAGPKLIGRELRAAITAGSHRSLFSFPL